MNKQPYFSGPAEYDQKRPYCVVYPSPNGYEIYKQYATRKAAQNACERGSMYAEVKTVAAVKKANAAAAVTHADRLLKTGDYQN